MYKLYTFQARDGFIFKLTHLFFFDTQPESHPNLSSLFSDISKVVINLQKTQLHSQSEEQKSKNKKRKHDDNDENDRGNDKKQPQHSSNNSNHRLQSSAPYFSAGEISFSVPQRKKLRLEFVRDAGIRAVTGTADSSGGDGGNGGMFAFGIGWADIGGFPCIVT